MAPHRCCASSHLAILPFVITLSASGISTDYTAKMQYIPRFLEVYCKGLISFLLFLLTTALANMYGNAGQIGEFPNVRERHTLKLVSRTYSEMYHIVPSSQPHRYQFKPASMHPTSFGTPAPFRLLSNFLEWNCLTKTGTEGRNVLRASVQAVHKLLEAVEWKSKSHRAAPNAKR